MARLQTASLRVKPYLRCATVYVATPNNYGFHYNRVLLLLHNIIHLLNSHYPLVIQNSIFSVMVIDRDADLFESMWVLNVSKSLQ